MGQHKERRWRGGRGGRRGRVLTLANSRGRIGDGALRGGAVGRQRLEHLEGHVRLVELLVEELENEPRVASQTGLLPRHGGHAPRLDAARKDPAVLVKGTLELGRAVVGLLNRSLCVLCWCQLRSGLRGRRVWWSGVGAMAYKAGLVKRLKVFKEVGKAGHRGVRVRGQWQAKAKTKLCVGGKVEGCGGGWRVGGGAQRGAMKNGLWPEGRTGTRFQRHVPVEGTMLCAGNEVSSVQQPFSRMARRPSADERAVWVLWAPVWLVWFLSPGLVFFSFPLSLLGSPWGLARGRAELPP